jgi:hypothetical protein
MTKGTGLVLSCRTRQATHERAVGRRAERHKLMKDVRESNPATAAAQDVADASGPFLEVSECLTGFSRVELLATGMARDYESALRKVYGDDVVKQLIREVRAVIKKAGGDEAKLEKLMLARVFNDDTVLCAPAKNLAQMWYLGTYLDYTDPTPIVIFKPTTVVSAEAYQQSLVLRDNGSHPSGAKQPGFGSWALGPPAAAPTSKGGKR